MERKTTATTVVAGGREAMPMGLVGLPPIRIIDILMKAQGRKYVWLAARAGMSPGYLNSLMSQKRHYTWKPGQREAVAGALGVPYHWIWQDPTVTVIDDDHEYEYADAQEGED